MNRAFTSVDAITDQDILDAFQASDMVVVITKRFGSVMYDYMSVGQLGWQLPMTCVFPIIGITPAMLRNVYAEKTQLVPRSFPFNLSWFGMNRRRYDVVSVSLPENIWRYNQLGRLPLEREGYARLAAVLKKDVMLMRDHGDLGDLEHMFTVGSDDVIDPTSPAPL